MSESRHLFVYECTNCGSGARLVGEQVSENGTAHTERLQLACGCLVCDGFPDPDTVPPDWVQNMDYEHPISAEGEV